MAERRKLTAAGIERIRPPDTGRAEYLDNVVPQLALRVTPNGSKTFVLRTRVQGTGRQIRITLGEHPALKLADARTKAGDALIKAKRGIDPNMEKRDLQRASQKQQANTVAAIGHVFIERYAKPNVKTWKEYDRILNRYVLPKWGKMPITAIRKSDVAALLDEMEDERGIYQANRCLAVIRKLFNWAMDERGLIEVNPVGHKMARGKEVSRERYLADDEITAIWKACEPRGYPFGPLFRLLLVTGQRRGEVSAMRWSQIEDDLWTIPSSQTKSGRPHVVPLSDLALDILANIPRFDGSDLVFTTNGDRPVSGFSKSRAVIEKVSGVTSWRLHDLRATMATKMENDLHLPPHIIGSVLNHAPGQYKGVTGVYTRADATEQRRQALVAWADLLAALVNKADQ